jgi:hypothetical protein
MLVGLRSGNGEQQAFVRCQLNVAQR